MIAQFFNVLWSLPKTLYFNFRCFPLRVALKLPVFVHYSYRLYLKTPKVSFSPDTSISTFLVRFGSRGSRGVIANNHGCICIENGSVIFNGFATFAYGCSIRVSGLLTIGRNFSANRNSFIACSRSVTIKNDVLTGWNISIRDTDGHTIVQDGRPKRSQKDVVIGNHVWICSFAHILKGVTIGDGSVVGYRATVTKPLPENNCLIVGFPAKVVQTGIEWGSYRPELEDLTSQEDETR